MIKPDPTIQVLRERVLDVFDDLRRTGLALDPRATSGVLRDATHLTFIHVARGASTFVAFGPVRSTISAEEMARACAHRGVSCEWEGEGHLVLVSPLDPQLHLEPAHIAEYWDAYWSDPANQEDPELELPRAARRMRS